MVKAIKYSVKVSEGVLAYIHGMTHTIDEIFIPDKKICFNIVKKQLNVFKVDKARGTPGIEAEEILLERDFVRDLEKLISLREKCFKKAKKMLKEGK